MPLLKLISCPLDHLSLFLLCNSTVEYVEMSADSQMKHKSTVYNIIILYQRSPVLLELLRFFPPPTYMGQSWEVSMNKGKRKKNDQGFQRKRQTMSVGTADRAAALLPKFVTKLGFRKQNCFAFAT